MAKKILVADDDELIRDAIKIAFRNEGYDIYEAGDGIEALNLARKIIPDLMILDVMMPGKVGYQVCSELKEDPDTKDIVIVFLTARGQHAQDIVRDVGGDLLIAKPFNIKELKQRIIRALEGEDK